MKQPQRKETSIQIPLADFLKHNDHNFLDSANELPHWINFLNFVAELSNNLEFQIRGSCIALAILRELGSLEPASGATEISHTLVPYTTFADFYKYLPEYPKKLTKEEQMLFEAILSSSNKKNIDIYLKLSSIEEVKRISQILAHSFVELREAKVGAFRILPNQIAALTIEVKGGYVDHEVILALKPPLKRDLRKHSSKRQRASKGVLKKQKNDWIVEINGSDVATLTQTDEFDFLNTDLPLCEHLLHTARALRFNSVYGTYQNSLENQLQAVAEKISSVFKTENRKEISQVDRYILLQVMNEMMLAFLHNPRLVIQFLSAIPNDLFPFINRAAVSHNFSQIAQILNQPIECYFSTPKKKHILLCQLIPLLSTTQATAVSDTEVSKKYSQTLDSIDEKIEMTETIEQHDTHTNWYFEKYTDFYLFQLLFQPLAIV